MKKIGLLFCFFLLGLALGVSANAAPTTGTWDSKNGDFAAGSWREKIWGGSEGAPGNELEAESSSYVFDGALLEAVELMSTPEITTPFYEYLTFYRAGTLTLANDPTDPWHNPEDLSLSFVADLGRTIVVTKKFVAPDDNPTDEMSFILTVIGEFPAYPSYRAEVIAYFRGTPTLDTSEYVVPSDSDEPVIMSGDLDFAKITITGPDTPDTEAVPVDIKPGSCPNPINVKSQGVIPAAILGTADFDVARIIPESIKLNGVSPIRWASEDVATPYEPFIGKRESYDCNKDGPDGYMDLTLKFSTQEIAGSLGEVTDRMVGSLGEVVKARNVVVLELTGELDDGTLINGEDIVIIKFQVR